MTSVRKPIMVIPTASPLGMRAFSCRKWTMGLSSPASSAAIISGMTSREICESSQTAMPTATTMTISRQLQDAAMRTPYGMSSASLWSTAGVADEPASPALAAFAANPWSLCGLRLKKPDNLMPRPRFRCAARNPVRHVRHAGSQSTAAFGEPCACPKAWRGSLRWHCH